MSDTALGKQLGNAMSVNVLERLLVSALPAARLIPRGALEDRWASGSAAKALAATRNCMLQVVRATRGQKRKRAHKSRTAPRLKLRRPPSPLPPPRWAPGLPTLGR